MHVELLLIIHCIFTVAFDGFVSGNPQLKPPFLNSRQRIFLKELDKIDYNAVKKDILNLMHSSKDFYPSDYGHYGPFFIRLAWHCSGTYRESDGEGGCDGGRQRFEPELSWEDNTNLDKARKLLDPIKFKYGIGLSYGDLYVLAGTVAIEDMNGPKIGFCGGRFDDIDGRESDILGPSDSQRKASPCPVNGDCHSPLGQNMLGQIYINPEGFLGEPDPRNTVNPIRDVFGRMGMNDSETVSLIGGGHSFGKTHGACSKGAGPTPKEQPENPWPGRCTASHSKDNVNTNKAETTFTTGFEGPWTDSPLTFDNTYFKLLLNFTYKKYKSPGGRYQFKIDNAVHGKESPKAPAAHGKEMHQDLMMLTADMAFLEDPIYYELVALYANDLPRFRHAFAHSWYKLVTRDLGPVSRCVGPWVSPPESFQAPLPMVSLMQKESFSQLKTIQKDIEDILDCQYTTNAWFIELAYLCASTFRVTDHNGGCNGARINLEPEKSWKDRKGTQQTIGILAPIKAKYSDTSKNTWTSLADLIVFSGTIALQRSLQNFKDSNPSLGQQDISNSELVSDFTFCAGRVDSDDAPNSYKLQNWPYADKAFEFKRQARLFGMSPQKLVALMGRPRSAEYYILLGYHGSYTMSATEENKLDNEYFNLLLQENWTKVQADSCCGTNLPASDELIFGTEYVNQDKTRYITYKDYVMLLDPELRAAVVDYAGSNEFFIHEFKAAWTQLMNADRFDGPLDNLCYNGKIELYEISTKASNGVLQDLKSRIKNAIFTKDTSSFDKQS